MPRRTSVRMSCLNLFSMSSTTAVDTPVALRNMLAGRRKVREACHVLDVLQWSIDQAQNVRPAGDVDYRFLDAVQRVISEFRVLSHLPQ